MFQDEMHRSFSSGRRVARLLGGGDAELAFDACEQAVLPWRRASDGWAAALRRDVEALRGLRERMGALRTQCDGADRRAAARARRRRPRGGGGGCASHPRDC